MVTRGIDQVAIECIVRALLATSWVQTLASPCSMMGGCVDALRGIVVADGNQPHVS